MLRGRTLAGTVLAGLLVGNLLSGLPHAENDHCLNTYETGSSDGGLRL